MTQCAYPGCRARGTLSNSTRGHGPWYCARHWRSRREAASRARMAAATAFQAPALAPAKEGRT
jgi:hypothetical protein